MLCQECKNRNPVGNKFCRECGAGLSVSQDVLAAEEAARAEVERNQERVARLLTDARLLAEQGKIEQAILLAEEASEQMPNSSSAHSLLATLYERVGTNAKAVAAMERVAALNPESEADRATLERLKKLAPGSPPVRLLARSATPETSRPTAGQNIWLPIAAAGMVGAFVLGVGLSVVNNRNADDTAQRSRSNFTNTTQVAQNGGVLGTQTLPVTSSGEAAVPGAVTGSGISVPKMDFPPPADSSADPFASQNPQGTANARPSAQPPPPANHAAPSISAAISSLPLPGGLTRNTTLGPAPVKLIGVPTNTSRPPANSGVTDGTFGQGGRITVGAPYAGTALPAPAATSAPPQGDGYIRISVRAPQASDSGASSASRSAQSDSSEGASGPLLRAQAQQSAGRYQEAVSSYQMAVSADPGSAGEAYQGMALCHQHLGDTGSARAAYRNALSAYERESASGRGGSSAQRGIASCKAALEVLGGG